MAAAKAQLSNYRQAPRKVRLVADLVRGKSAARALMLLDTLPKRASLPMAKLIRSAVANAQGASASDLYISKIAVDGGIVFKRMMPRARGRGAPILKRTSHVVVELEKSAPKKAKASKAKKQEQAPVEAQ